MYVSRIDRFHANPRYSVTNGDYEKNHHDQGSHANHLWGQTTVSSSFIIVNFQTTPTKP